MYFVFILFLIQNLIIYLYLHYHNLGVGLKNLKITTYLYMSIQINLIISFNILIYRHISEKNFNILLK